MVHNNEMLFTHVVLHLSNLLNRGDYKSLGKIGLNQTQANRLLELHATDLNNLSTLLSQCLKIEIDPECFDGALDYLAERRAQRASVTALIQAEAPLPMIKELFGIGGMEYSGLRRCHLGKVTNGRPENLTEEEDHRLWAAWQKTRRGRNDQPLTGDDYLAIYEHSGHISLKHAWPVLNRYRQPGASRKPGSTTRRTPQS